MVPDLPTAIKSVEVVVFVSSVVEPLDVLLFLAQEMTVRLKRNRERIMRICLTWFSISGLGEPNIYQNLGCFTMCVGFYLEVF